MSEPSPAELMDELQALQVRCTDLMRRKDIHEGDLDLDIAVLAEVGRLMDAQRDLLDRLAPSASPDTRALWANVRDRNEAMRERVNRSMERMRDRTADDIIARLEEQ